VIVLRSKRGQLGSEHVRTASWRVLEESSRVENFSIPIRTHCVIFKTGARHHAVGSAPRTRFPTRRYPLSRDSRPGSYADRGVVGNGSGRMAIPKTIPGQKSYIRGCQVRNTPRWNARNILLTSSPLQVAELRCFVLPVVSWFAFMTALFGFLKLTS